MKQHVLLRVLSAEADRDALRPILDALKEKGLRVSAAEGSLKKGEILLAALSGHFYADGEKQKTLLEVLSTGAENVLPLKLDETEIPETLMNALYARNIIMADGRDAGLIAERILAAVPEKKSARFPHRLRPSERRGLHCQCGFPDGRTPRRFLCRRCPGRRGSRHVRRSASDGQSTSCIAPAYGLPLPI